MMCVNQNTHLVSRAVFVAPLQARLPNGDISHRRLLLLKAIHDAGSITQASKKIGITYKAAWKAVEIMNHLTDVPLVVVQRGGKDGGGALLTSAGLRLVITYQHLSEMQAMWLSHLREIDYTTVICP